MIDCRSWEVKEANNRLLVVCEHGSNDLKGFKTTLQEEGLVRSNDGFDPGAAELASYICEQTECTGLLTNFSKLIINPSQPVCNGKLANLHFDSYPELAVSFNSDLNEARLQ